MARKVHNTEPGYIAERTNPITGGKVVIYKAADQGIDCGGDKYAVVCDTHGTVCGVTSVPKARVLMKWPEFCEECMDRVDKHLTIEA